MLTKAEAVAEVRAGRIYPDRLTPDRHRHYLAYAEEMLRIYHEGTGRTREELHEAVRPLFWGESDCPPRRINAFCKLLDDAAEFEEPQSVKAAELRMRVFTLAAPRHPVVRHPGSVFAHREAEVKAAIAATLGEPWETVEEQLFSDVFELRRLRAFPGYDSPSALLRRYNEAQLQATLYDATRVVVTARDDYRPILMAAKRAGLMHEAERLPGNRGFRFTFYGPASPLRITRRYGVHLARIIPTLLTCREWELTAPIRFFPHGPPPLLRLTSRDRYKGSAVRPEAFDSRLERDFAEKWGTHPRDGWRLERESEPRFTGQKVFFPDFTFVHADGRRVIMEIVGHWTPEYLQAKQETLRLFRNEPLLLAIPVKQEAAFGDLGLEIIPYRTVLKVEPFLAALGRLPSRQA